MSDGRLFGRALGELAPPTTDPFTRSVSALLTVAAQVDDLDDKQMMIAHAARLLARAGEVDVALDLVERELEMARAVWDGAGVYADSVDALLAVDQLTRARQVVARAIAFATRVRVFERGGDDPALSDLLDEMEKIGRPGVPELVRDLVPDDKRSLLVERDLRRAVERKDLAAALSALAVWSEDDSLPQDEWLLRDVGCLAAERGDTEAARRIAGWQQKRSHPELAVETLLMAGFEDAARSLLSQLAPGWIRAGGLAAMACHAGRRGDREAFDEFARRAIQELPQESVQSSWVLSRVAEAARLCLSRAAAEAWGERHLPASARQMFRAQLQPPPADDPERPSVAELPALAVALEMHDWPRALAELRSVGNGYLDLEHARALAKPAAAAGRNEIVLAALQFSLGQLGGPFADQGRRSLSKEEYRFLTARLLGETARALLAPNERQAFADEAFAQAARLENMASAAALVIAAGLACRPDTARLPRHSLRHR